MSATTTAAGRRVLAGMVGLLLAAGMLALVPATAARADSAPALPSPATPITVTADALPTTQIDGVAWSQVVVGNTVYVAGQFSRARPAGAAPGTQETVRNNLLAFDIRTGQLVTSFAPDLNAQALVVTASPDGSRIYVGGDFTRADGQVRNRVAAYSTATGQLVPDFRPSASSSVRAIAASDGTVYLGGVFTALGSQSRHRLAAVTAATGALLPWNPVPGPGPILNRNSSTATSDVVRAIVLTGGGSQVVVGGHFDTLNGEKATGVGALDAVTGATRPFAVNRSITNQGVNGAVYDLTTDGTDVYGVAYDYYGPGNLEGSFSAAADGGAINWINECHGDSYSVHPMNGALYLAGHPHVCGNIGGFHEHNPRVHRYATALSLQATGTVGTATLFNSRVMPDGTVVHRNAPGNYPSSGTLLQGKPAPSLLNWFPTMSPGAYTGQGQAGWSVSGNDTYVVYGGEFPRVNGAGQQGLVRFALPSAAPNRIGPDGSGLAAAADSPLGGMARVGWTSVDDRDNEHLTYRVYRDGNATTPVYETTRSSLWWRAQPMAFVDLGVAAGPHTYRVSVFDAFGNRANSPWVSVDVAAGSVPQRAYADAVRADGAQHYWPLGDPSGDTAHDHAGRSDLTVGTGVSAGQDGAIAGDADTAYRFDGTSAGLAATRTAVPGPTTFTVEAWFRTTSTQGGKIVGFGSAATGTSGSYDRHVYLDADGRVVFGVYPGAQRTVASATAHNDGQWHHVAASLSPAGMALYVDGELAGTRADTTSAQVYNGYWRIGGDTSWSGAAWLDGLVDDVAVYPTALTDDQVAGHFALGTGTALPVPPSAAFTSSVVDLAVSFDGTGSTDADGVVTGHAWDFGDGSTATGVTAAHTYAAAGTYPVTLTVTDDAGLTATTTQQVTVTAPGGPEEPGVLAADAFDRSVSGGLGAADVGGTWTTSVGATRQSVADGAAVLTVGPGNNAGSFLGGVSAPEADVRATFSVSRVPASGSGAYVYVAGRRVGTNLEYRARVRVLADGSVGVAVTRLSGTASETVLGPVTTLPGFSYTPDTQLELRLRVSGSAPTTLDLTVWPAGTAEPSTPTISRTDTTAALQAPGAVGLAAYLSASSTSPVTVRFDDLRVTSPGASAPVDQPPLAAFTTTSTGLSVAVDGAGSSDPDGSIASYTWAFGDGGTGTGATASHTYSAAGTYTVALTVTDDDGLTATTTRPVTVTAPGDPQQEAPLAADAFERTGTGGLGVADVGGAWTVLTGAARQAVTGGAAVLTVGPGNNAGSHLGSVSRTAVDVRTTLSFSRTPANGTGAYAFVTGRRVGTAQYKARVRVLPAGEVGVALVREVGGVETTLGFLTLPGLTYTADLPLQVHLRVAGSGTTNLELTVWPADTAQPATPTLVRTDTTAALQAAGSVGLAAYLSGSSTTPVAVRFDDLQVTAPQ